MLKNTRIVRNYAVFCSESLIRNKIIDVRAKSNGKIKKVNFTKEYVLSDIFKEEADYDTLMHHYSEACKGKENQYFPFAYFIDKKHAIRIDENNNIILYYYQDLPRIGIPWSYPHLITCIGTTDKDTTLISVINDLKRMTTLDFLLKYYFKKTEVEHRIDSIEEGYLIDGFLKIIANPHVVFCWLDSDNNWQEQYISDPWWSTKEEVLHDLTSMNLMKYGKKYEGFWGR